MRREYLYALVVLEVRDSVNARHEVRKPSSLRFFKPRFVVGVAVEDDALVLLERADDKVVQCFLERCAVHGFSVGIRREFELVGELLQRLGNYRVEYDVRGSDIL